MLILIIFVKSAGTEGESKAIQVMSNWNKNLASCCAAYPSVELPNPKSCRLPPWLAEQGGMELNRIRSIQPGQWQFLVIKSRLGESQRHCREVEQSSFPGSHLLAEG